MPLIIAHRTSPAFAPENSLEGVRVSFEQGADGVEVDLRVSLDLQPFLMHDNTMRRTTGWPLPIELTPSFLVRRQQLRGGSEPVPDLGSAIDALPPGRLLAVDVKTPWSVFALRSAIEGRGLESRTLVWCSSALVVRWAVSRMKGVEVAYYKDFEDGPNNIEFIGRAARIGAHAVSLDWRAITNAVVAAAHSLGLKVYSWHKEHPVDADRLAAGLDGVITDYPARTREEIGGL